jgi:YesN/AraC family two-component response regulator
MGVAKGDKRRGKYQVTIFQLFLFVTIVPLLIAGIISYKIYMEEVTKQTDLSMEATEMQVSNDVESILSGIRQYFSEVSSRDEVNWLTETTDIPYREFTNLYDAQKLLQGPVFLNGYIESYAFINIKNGWILTNNGMFGLSDIKNKTQFQGFLDNVADNPSTLYWFNNIDEASPYSKGLFESNNLDVSGFHLVMKLPGISNRIDQLILVQLNLSNLKQRLATNLATYDICILNRKGESIYTTDKQLEVYCHENIETIKNYSGSISNISVSENQDYRIRIRNKSSNGMIYVTAYNLNEVREGAGKVLSVSLLIIVALVLLLLICWFFTSILYKPVKNLTSYVSEVVGEQEEKRDEFTYIRENVGHLINIRENLQQMVQNQQTLLIEQFMLRMIRGELTMEAINSSVEQFQLKKMRYYHLLAAVCMRDNETDQDSKLENEALSMVITKNMPIEISKILISPPFCQSEVILLVIGADEEVELRNKTLLVHKNLTQYIEKEYGYSIISGVSQIFTRLKYLRTAYNECTEALKNTASLQNDHEAITFYEYFAKNDNIISGYDFVVEKSLISAVNSSMTEEAAQLVDKFVNSLNNRGITRHDRNYYLHRIMISVLSVLTDAGLSPNQVFAERSDDIFLKLSHIYENDKLKHYMNTHIVQPIIEALKQFRYNESSDIMKKVMDIVQETKGDITLSECAQKLNYHPSYIWKVLKAEKNMTFTDLVTKEKIETAKQMLLKSEYSVAEIAELLNYSNTQNFIRFFSKYLHTTPGKYRKENKEVE